MTTRELAELLGRDISLFDKRTGARYTAFVGDARTVYGTLHLSVADGEWFVPTGQELASLKPMEVSARG